jgi:hypothetical protein
MQTIFPILRYNDARNAIRSLCATFGFVELFSIPDSGPFVRHAQLKLGTNVIMLGSVRADDGMASPQTLEPQRRLFACMLTIWTRISSGRKREVPKLPARSKIPTLGSGNTTSVTWKGMVGRLGRTGPK